MRIGAVAILGAAGASAAIASDGTGARATALTAAATDAVSRASLPAAANETAVLVLDAIAGGARPSSIAAQRSQAEPRGQATQAKNESAGLISAGQRQGGSGTVGTIGTRPGWGCGDKNHIHTGPPGRTGAESPCER